MRKRFEQQFSLGIKPISEVYIRTKCRDELPPVLVALQKIFITPELNQQVFDILEEKICSSNKKTGRQGMDLWHILVLSIVRQTLNTNWDRLHYLSNNDMTMRSIMGLRNNDFEDGFHEFEYQNILDNVSLLDAETINKINAVVVNYGVELLKKKEDEELKLKTDSFVIETNVHFPTDLNLLNDSIRAALNRLITLLIKGKIAPTGWRKINSVIRDFKTSLRSTSWAVFKGKKEDYKIACVKNYISKAEKILVKLRKVLENSEDEKLLKYTNYIELFVNQIDRRLLKGETIDSSEKVYSIFEEHTEWISKGKRNPELGNLMMITTNQYHLIMDAKIMFKEKDASQIIPLVDRLKVNYPNESIYSLSTDKGFWSKDNFEYCVNSGIKNTVIPKKGKCNKEEYARQHDSEFIKLRHKHSAIESNINMLEHHGLNRCMDKGKDHFESYVSLAVLAFNLHIIGNAIVKKRIEEQKKKTKPLIKIAA